MVRMFILVAIFACCAPAAAGTPPRQVFIAGDSTASHYGPERAPREGWGQQLQGFLDDDAYVVRNHAQSGRSSRSFIAEGWFDGMAKDMRSGDVLLIQFGHNDEKIEDPTRYNEPQRAFPQWLARYVALAREKGATPILVTPLARRKFERGSKIDQLLDTHRELGSMPASLSYGRGRPRPLFQGAAPKVILAGWTPPALHKLFDSHTEDIAAAGLPSDWSAFRRYFSQIRKNGHYFSDGELESNLAAVAVPLHQADGSVIAALSLVTSVQRMAVIDRSKLTPLIQRAAREISARLH